MKSVQKVLTALLLYDVMTCRRALRTLVEDVPIQDISDTVGHKSTHGTETVYRHVIVPAVRGGASVMDDVFGDDDQDEKE